MLIPVPETTITRILLAACLFLTLSASVDAARDDVLIVVNDNSIDSPVVGAYYAEQRDIAPENIVHVQVPNSYFITWDEFRSLRDQIIHFMQQNTLDDPELEPAPCVNGDPPYYCQASVEQLRAHTRIRYLVMTRGLPSRMTVDGSTLTAAAALTSVDNYLNYWLVNYFTEDVGFPITVREKAFGDGRGMRTVIPAEDRELVVGRIDGLDLDLAKALVDRAQQAERDGLYGKLYSSTKFTRWMDHSTNQRVYPDWRYQLGVFGETRPECVDYLNYAGTLPEGKAPSHCLVRLNEGVDTLNPAPGNAASRAPLADDALVYKGWVDGQSAVGSFAGVLNWRRNDQCSLTLCKNSADPAACRAASTDVFQEINTDCVGVAEGFIGYNHQSYPLSFLTLWPTGWYQTTSNTSWTSKGGGEVFALGFPEVRNDIGFDDSHSLWFRNSDQVPAPGCYPDSDFSGPPSLVCVDSRRVILAQRIALAAQTLDTSNPQTYRVAFRYKASNINAPTPVRVRFFVHEIGGGTSQIDYGTQVLATLPAGDTDWTLAAAQFQLDPTLHTAPSYDGIKIRIETANQFAGELGFDAISVQAAGQPVELIKNGSFTRGFEQVATGDHAAVFLNRLNGTAFFGSVSHHGSGGCAFCFNPLEQLVYFMRGLPLGDAVWFDDILNSGILYGDPLYSPVAVRLTPVNADDRVSGLVKLHGSTVNGRDPARVSTTYAI
ncbi:MAG: TIGR03790 family protein, partial [Pseudomonadota bacterium]|nr:TIGR03790 family protein [Pseudomonadota bacterium]